MASRTKQSSIGFLRWLLLGLFLARMTAVADEMTEEVCPLDVELISLKGGSTLTETGEIQRLLNKNDVTLLDLATLQRRHLDVSFTRKPSTGAPTGTPTISVSIATSQSPTATPSSRLATHRKTFCKELRKAEA